jgi:hypothetical protein
MSPWLIFGLLLLILFVIGSTKTENFLDLHELETPLNIQNECAWKEGCGVDDCEVDIPLITEGCNNVPNYPRGLEPKANTVDDVRYPEVPFHRLAPKSGKYTFVIPELKYDGIYSRKLDNSNRCCWSNKPNKPETYGANNLLHVPDKSFNGKTIVEPPECEGYPTGYPPHYYIYDCKENNIPCTISRQIVV